MALSMKARKFRLHFNQNNMRRGLREVWTIHLSDACIAATEVVLNVPVTSVYRPGAAQPRAWFAGKGIIVQRAVGQYSIEAASPTILAGLRGDH
jgi:hypothetical protein